jgi:putative transcriptional regulator
MIAHLQRNIGIVGGGDSPDFFHLFPAGFAGSIIGGMQSLKGQLLVATPALKDPNFFRTVLMMVQHDENGALGLVLNRPLEMTLKAAWEEVSETPCFIDDPLHQGGPCEGPLMVLHTDGDSQMQVADGLHFTTDRDAIEQLVSAGDGRMKFFVGYAGWTPGQLEREIEEGAWVIRPGDAAEVFSEDQEQWATLFKARSRPGGFLQIDPRIIPEDPSLN